MANNERGKEILNSIDKGLLYQYIQTKSSFAALALDDGGNVLYNFLKNNFISPL